MQTPGGNRASANQTIQQRESTPDQKRLANIVAQMALAGHAVHTLETGFLVTRWGMTKVCPDLAALLAFGRVLGVSQ
jgi:hypothetical protein